MFERIKRLPIVKFIYNLPGTRRAYHLLLAFLGTLIYGRPDRKIFVIGVTGTKGKTTTLELLNAVLEAAGRKTALLSSLRAKIGEHSEKNLLGNTMPGRFYIKKFLRRAVAAHCKYALVEVTSEGVAMHRHRFISWNIGVLTNVAPEHIEAHGSFEKYRQVKLDFLKYVLGRGGKVLINRDDKSSKFLIDALEGKKVVTYSKNDERIFPLIPEPHPVRGAVEAPPFILSEFNKDNVAAAITLARDLGINEKIVAEALRDFRGVPGRMEFIRRGPFTAVIDYAHTPASLEAVYRHLKNSRPTPRAPRLICVLGSAGGGRDKWKRPVMGKVAAQYCDEIILTDEDPYDEKSEEIIEQIARGSYEFKPPSEVLKILDRREAVRRAIEIMDDGDIVVVTGKGSEDFIHIAHGKKIPWNERRIVEEELARKEKRPEPMSGSGLRR